MSNMIPLLSKLTAYAVPIVMASAAFYAYQVIDVPNEICGFKFVSKRNFPEINAVGYLYEHEKHGCPFLHIETKDSHNFFATTYRTTCIDNTGSTHVLEHLSLHGSEKYPIRSVFIELMKNSLATFMNAFTSIEWTAYPFSSTNHKDFHNLLDVYLDSTFHPRLDKISFESECHHLEFEQPNNKSTPLRHSGVVYNEMNGDTSRPDAYFSNLVRKNLYPNSLFRFQYGGNPPDIANLTLKDIKEQHERYYHPCNALFFHYGSFNATEIMAKINSVIEPFNKSVITIPDELVDQPRWSSPKYVEAEGPADNDPTKVRASMTWMVGDLRNYSEIIDLSVLMALLSDSTLSPLFKGLVEKGYGTKYFETGFSPFVRSPYLSIGLQGMNGTNVNLNKTVLDILNKVYDEGFDQDRIKSILHQQEIEQKTVSDSEGIKLWEQIVSSWIHGVDPFDLIDIKWEFERIKSILAVQPRYFEILMKRKLIDNPHRLDLIMRGVKDFQENIALKTKKELEEKKAKMSEEEKDKIVELAAEIKKSVDAPKPLELLPKISVDDISKEAQKITYEKEENIFFFEQPTNGIAYLRIKADMPLNRRNIQDVKLLKSVLTSVGADDMNEDQFTKQEELYTNGIGASLLIAPSISNSEDLHAYLTIESSALTRDIPVMLSLIQKVVTKPHLDNIERIKLILKMKASGFSSKIASSGHQYASSFAESGLSRGTALGELWGGVTFRKMLQKIDKEENWDEISKRIIKAYNEIFMQSNFTASIHCEKSVKQDIMNDVSKLLSSLNKHETTKTEEFDAITEFMNQQKLKNNTILEIDSSTFFCDVSMKGPSYSSEEAISRFFTVNLLKSEFLHDLIREKLGAYGVIGTCDMYSGTTSFVSYRDTNPVQVLKAFREALDLAINQVDDDMIKRTIIRIISKIDHPVSPGNVGLNRFYNGFTNELAQKTRTKILKMTKKEVIQQAKEMKGEKWTSCIVGNSATTTKPDGFNVIKVFD